MTMQEKWDRIYATSSDIEPRAAYVLSEYRHLLPNSGVALDLACGLGGNARLMAGHGLETHAWDISPVAIDKLRQHAQRLGYRVNTKVCNAEEIREAQGLFNVVVVSRFLERDLCDSIMASLRPGGLLFYQTFIREKVSDEGPNNPDFLLQRNELLTLYSSLNLINYREEAGIGDVTKGFRNEALLIAERRIA